MSTQDIVSIKILVGGASIEDKVEVSDINIQSSLNRITSAKITIIDGDPAEETFEISSGNLVTPGKEIEIQAGYENKTKSIFKGIIISQTIQSNHEQGSSLVIDCKDKALKMTVGRKSGAFVDKTDSDIMQSLVSRNGLSASITSTTAQLKQLVQYSSSDWDLLITRAEINGMVTVTSDNKVTVAPPALESSVLTLTYGVDILEIDTTLSAGNQLNKVTANAWDYTTQEMTTSNATTPSTTNQGNLTGSTLGEILAPDKVNLVTTSALETANLTSWASGKLLKSRFSKIKGRVKVFGNSNIKPNQVITFKGLGERFNGDAYVSGIEHEIKSGTWSTYITTGMSYQWFAEEVETSAPLAAGLLPGVQGLQNATVKAITEDPDNQFRVQVTVHSMTADSQPGELWARWIQPYASKEAGFFFMPEIGDEVILAFLNDDPRFPVILGSVYSSNNSPATQPAKENPIKSIVSKEKLTVEMDDKNKILTIKTPGNNQIILSDDDKAITIKTTEDNQIILSDQDKGITMKDQNNNQIIMNSNGIEIKSASDITINATASLTEKAAKLSASYSSEASISATGSFSISGLELEVKGDTSFSASAPQTKVSADAMLTLEGGLIKIN